MLRVLTLSTLFPSQAKPTFGVFVERQTRGLAALPDVEVEVMAPLGMPRWPLTLHPHYAPHRHLAAREERKGLIVHRPRFPVNPALGQGGTARALASALLPRLVALRERFPFDVIDAEFFWPDGPAAMLLSRALGVPFSIKARGADIHYWGHRRGVAGQIAAAGTSAGGLLAVSSALADDMAKLGLPRDRIRVHHTGIDLSRFRPIERAAAKQRLGIEGPLLATVGALVPRKGQTIALAALEKLPEATLLLIGDGPDRAQLEGQIRGRRLKGRAQLLGNLPHEQLPDYLAAADVMVLPTASEGLANVWVEALACGTPVVTSDVGGAREAILPGTGHLVPRDPGPIAEAVSRLLDDPPDPSLLRMAAARFSWDRNAAELREHLYAVAGKSKRHQGGSDPAFLAAQ